MPKTVSKDCILQTSIRLSKGEVERNLVVSRAHIEKLQHDKGEVERELKKRYAKYSTLRVDIRNKGAEGSNLIGSVSNSCPGFFTQARMAEGWYNH